MDFQTRIEKRAKKQILKLPRSYQIKVYTAIAGLKNDPFQGKKLEGELKGQYSIRVWPYRIIYQIYKKELIISVIDVGHRQSIYS